MGWALPILFVFRHPDGSKRSTTSFRHPADDLGLAEGNIVPPVNPGRSTGRPTDRKGVFACSDTQLGRPIDQAMTEMGERVGSKNLSFVMTAS